MGTAGDTHCVPVQVYKEELLEKEGTAVRSQTVDSWHPASGQCCMTLYLLVSSTPGLGLFWKGSSAVIPWSFLPSCNLTLQLAACC